MSSRPEKHFSGKYASSRNSDNASSGYQSLPDTSNKARSSLRTIYVKLKATPYSTNLPDNVKQLATVTDLFLTKSDPGKRLADYMKTLVELSLEDCDTGGKLKELTSALTILEDYSLKLAWYPWKNQIKRIKTYSAYVKMYVEPYFKGYREIFKRLGYRRSELSIDELVIDKMKDRDVIMEVAFDCYVARKEIEMYVIIFSKVQNDGYSVRNVHECRLKCRGTDNESIQWIIQHCTPIQRPVFTASPNDPKSPPYHTKDNRSVENMDHSNIPTTIDKETAERLKMYREEASLSGVSKMKIGEPVRKAPAIPPRSSSSSSKSYPTADINLQYMASHRPSEFKAGTLDEHVSESLREVDSQDSAAPSSMAPSKPASRDSEWSEVYKKVENLGEKYYDPGGRGDILRGDRMVPHADDDEDETLPPPPPAEELENIRKHDLRQSTSQSFAGSKSFSPYNAAKYAQEPIKSSTSGYGSRGVDGGASSLVSPTQTSGYGGTRYSSQSMAPRAQLTESSDLYSANTPPAVSTSTSARPAAASHADRSTMRTSRSSYNNSQLAHHDVSDGLKITVDDHASGYQSKYSNIADAKSANFTTFGGKPAKQDSYQSKIKGNEDPDYVQLKQVSPPGKPSQEKNFQDTAQRMYQAPSNTSLARSSTDYGTTRAAFFASAPPSIGTSRDWQCKSCTFMNRANISTCAMCDKSRNKGSEATPLTTGSPQCPACTFVNQRGAKECKTCGEPLKNSATFV